MIKRKVDKFWFPWWPEKWLWGTIRIECTPAERGIWVDMLSVASKDDGHIRANEETPYPLKQLAGMLIIPEKELDAAINKFIKLGKINKLKAGTLYIAKWEKYQFSERHKRRIEEGVSEKEDDMSKKTALNNNKLNHSILNNNKLNNNTEILNLLSKVKNYPLNKEKDLEFIKGLKVEFPDVDILEKVKQITINWLKFPLTKKSRPRVQIRRWVTNEQKWQKEGDKERHVGKLKDGHKEKYPMLFLSYIYKLLRKQGKDTTEYSKLIHALADEEAQQASVKYKDSPADFIKFLEDGK